MSRTRRLLLTLVVALAVLLGLGAFGKSAKAAGPEIGPLPGTAPVSAPLEAPRDEVVAHGALPPLPHSYITKDLGWMELSYPPSAADRVTTMLAESNAWKEQIQDAFAQPVLNHVTVRIAPTFSDMARLAPEDAPPPGYASGVAYHGRHLILLTMMSPKGPEAVDLDETLRHELAHVALEDAVGGKHVPVWFNEGLAIWLSAEAPWARTQILAQATMQDRLIPLSDLDRSMPPNPFEVNIAYAESADFTAYLLRKSDRLRFTSMIDRVREGQTFDQAVKEAYNADLRKLELEWHHKLERNYSVVPILLGGSLIWVGVMGLVIVAWAKRRKRTKAILAKWEREEAIEDARIAKALELQRAAENKETAPSSIIKVSLKTEQNGDWHTLH
jgi:hypothetical protein